MASAVDDRRTHARSARGHLLPECPDAQVNLPGRPGITLQMQMCPNDMVTAGMPKPRKKWLKLIPQEAPPRLVTRCRHQPDSLALYNHDASPHRIWRESVARRARLPESLASDWGNRVDVVAARNAAGDHLTGSRAAPAVSSMTEQAVLPRRLSWAGCTELTSQSAVSSGSIQSEVGARLPADSRMRSRRSHLEPLPSSSREADRWCDIHLSLRMINCTQWQSDGVASMVAVWQRVPW